MLSSRWLAARRTTTWGSLFLLALAIFAAAPLYRSTWFDTHEMLDPLQRAFAMGCEISSGQIYPRWLSAAYWGKGSPLPNFYAPGVYLVSAYLFVFGLSLQNALKLVGVACFFLGAEGMFLWMRRHVGVWGALVAAVLYLFAPYHFVDLYVRGAFAEFAAIGWYPFLFYGLDVSFGERGWKYGGAVTAFSTFAILFCHNLSAVMIALFAALYFVATAYRERAGLRRTVMAGLGPLIGVTLAAFYWLPCLVEMKYLIDTRAALTTGYFSFENHFVMLPQLFSTFWAFGRSEPGPGDWMSFQVGAAILVFTAVALSALPIMEKRRRYLALTLFGMGVVSVSLTLELASSVYSWFPPFRFVQFPWRFLGPASVFLCAACGFSAEWLRGRPFQRFGGVCLVGVAVCSVVALSVAQRNVRGRDLPDLVYSTETMENVVVNGGVGALCGADEYLPRWANPDLKDVAFYKRPSPFSAAARFWEVKTRGSTMSFLAEAGETAAAVGVPWFYFPGWEVEVDGAVVRSGPNGDGFLSFNLPPGRHAVRIRFGTTAPRVVGRWLSGGALVLLGALFLVPRKREGGRT